MGLVGTFSKGSNPISQNPATKRPGVGGAVAARRKLLMYWFLCRQIRPIPGMVQFACFAGNTRWR